MTPPKNANKPQRKSFKLAALDVVRGALGSTKKTFRLVVIILSAGAAYGLYKAAVIFMGHLK